MKRGFDRILVISILLLLWLFIYFFFQFIVNFAVYYVGRPKWQGVALNDTDKGSILSCLMLSCFVRPHNTEIINIETGRHDSRVRVAKIRKCHSRILRWYRVPDLWVNSTNPFRTLKRRICLQHCKNISQMSIRKR